MSGPAEKQSPRQRALQALVAGVILLAAIHAVLPTLILKSINRQLAPANLKLDASIHVSLPNRITLSTVKIQNTAGENMVSAERLSIVLRPSALFDHRTDRLLAQIAIHGLQGSWAFHSTTPSGSDGAPHELSLPKHIPDDIEISVIHLTLTLPPKPGAQVRQLTIKDLSLDASTTRDGNFHVSELTAGDSKVLQDVVGGTTFLNKQLSIRELKLSEKNFIEHLNLDFGSITKHPSVDFLLLRDTGYISAKATLSSTQSGQSFSLRTDAENVILPLDPFASTTKRALPHIEIHESHTVFEGSLSEPSSLRIKASFSGSVIDSTDADKKSPVITEINLSERGVTLEKLSIEDPALLVNASASASINSSTSSFTDSIAHLACDWSVKYAPANHSSPFSQLADHFGNPIPKWLPSTQISARISQSENRALKLQADFEITPTSNDPSKPPSKGTLVWSAPSLQEASIGSLEVETQSFQTTFWNTPVSIPASTLRVINNQSNRHLNLTLHLANGRTSILTQDSSVAPWKISFENIPLRELLPHIPAENPCTLSANTTVEIAGENVSTISGSFHIHDPTNSVFLNADFGGTQDVKVTTTLLHQTLPVATAELVFPHHDRTSGITITSNGNIESAHAFRNLLSLANVSPGTSSRIAWNAAATLSPNHRLPVGRLACNATGITIGNIGPIDLKSTIQSTGSSIETQAITLSLGETTVTGKAQWSTTLSVNDLQIMQRNRPVLHGELSIHHPIGQSSVPNSDAPLLAKLEADQLDLATLLGDTPTLTGKVHGAMTITGTLNQPVIRGKMTSSKLSLPGALAPLNPLAVEIVAHPAQGAIALSATVNSALIAPIELSYNGSIRTLLSPQTPLKQSGADTTDTFSISLKGGTLQPLNKLNDIFKSVAGSIDVGLSAKRNNGGWEWTGKSSIRASKLLFESPRAPGLTDLTLNATVKDSTTTSIDLLSSTGGGTIKIRGDIRSLLTRNPIFDLSVQTRNVLAYRNESLLLRADSDLTFKGPWSEASISGEAAPVQSKYLHDIEILPFNLTKTGETRDRLKGLSPGFSFAQAPYSDWKFNIHFKSRPRDPLLVRGNRWQGEADIDMTWGGTGLRPWFEGYYHSKNLTAFLPSVRLAVSDGYLWYKRDNPFQGNLDVNALTTARGYRIAAYISGPLSQPDLLLTSKPALDQTDILSLLTTGVLPSDSIDSPQVIAARATEAIAEDLSRSLFGVDRRTIEGLGRVDVEFSRVNPRTGQQETRITRRLSEDWSVSGDIGTNGDFTGRLKFLHRFK